MNMRFGTAGVPRSARDSSTLAGLAKLAELGLGCLEIEFVQRVTMGEKMAALVRTAAHERGIHLSVHAPYYINLNAHDPKILEASRKRLSNAARIGYLAGATDIVFHAGFYQGDPPVEAHARVREELGTLVEELHQAGIRVTLRPETTGKCNQYGSLDETLRLVQEVPGLAPCVDFSHLHARKPYRVREEFLNDLTRIERELGRSALEVLHLHLSGMNYTSKGERNHLNLGDSDMPWRMLLEALREGGCQGRVICESPNQEEDALLLQQTWDVLENSVK